MKTKILSILMLVLIPILASANGVSLSADNDMFYKTDRDYTHGTKLTYMSENIPSKLDGLFLEREKKVHYIFGQFLYTSTDITVEELMPEDRPYAGWLYAGFMFQAYTPTKMDIFEIDMGVTGEWSLGEETQTTVHDTFGNKTPMGWDNQISEEIGINVIWQERLKFKATKNIEIIPHYGASLGTVHTFLNAGCMLRVGHNLPDDFGPLMMEPVSKDFINWHAYVFADTDGRLIGRNLFLDGNTFADSHSVEKENLVGDFRLGVSVGIRNLEVIYAYTARSKEYKTQEDYNEFGSLILSWKY